MQISLRDERRQGENNGEGKTRAKAEADPYGMTKKKQKRVLRFWTKDDKKNEQKRVLRLGG
jgi:hypothetical protein